jgi:hypothetical protein
VWVSSLFGGIRHPQIPEVHGLSIEGKLLQLNRFFGSKTATGSGFC